MIQHLEILIVCSLFKNGHNDTTRDSFNKYRMPLVEIKDFHVLIDKKPLFDQPVKKQTRSKWKTCWMSRNDYYATGNSLDFSYHQGYYKVIGIDLSRQTDTSISQDDNFTEKLEEDDGATMFSLLKSRKKLF